MEQMEQRITLVSRGGNRDWESTDLASSAVMAVDSISELTLAVVDLWTSLDIERVVLDGGASASQFLDLMTALPQEFAGDVVMIRNDGSGFLSATSRGKRRVLSTLTAPGVDFYMQVNGLVPFEVMPRLQAAA